MAPPPSCTPVCLRLSDHPQIDAGATVLPLAARDAVLLAWLAVEGPTARERLGALLWPESSAAQARTALRQRLFKMKKLLGRDVAVGFPTLMLAPDVEHDLGEATELLGDLNLPDAPELDIWLRRQRELRRGQEHEMLHAQADALEAAGETESALRVAQALLRLQPLSERAHQRVMRLHYLLGDRATALAAFDVCEQVLKHELGTRPGAATLALLDTLERADAAAPRGTVRMLPAAIQRPPEMVGRAAELAQLRRAWGSDKVAVVTGEAGQGKSRLLAEFGATWPSTVLASARPGDAGMPFASLVRLLRAMARQASADGLDADTLSHLSRLLPEWRGDGGVFIDAPPQSLLHALERWLHILPAGSGLVLDDLHFADDASLEMLQALLAQYESRPPGTLHWALAWRGGEASARLLQLFDGLADAVRLAHIELGPLDEGALAVLVDQLNLGWSGAAVARPLLQRTGGNALFLLETLKQAWLEPADTWPTPPSVQHLLDRRVARLATAPLALARVAAIAGSDFSIDLGAAVLGSTPLQLADALHALESAQVLRGTGFVHDLVADAVFRSVPNAVALHTHAQVATWLETQGGEPARIASHWFAAGQPAKAPPWLGRAAQRSLQMMRNREALAFMERKAEAEAAAGDLATAFATQTDALSLSMDVDRDAARGAARCERLLGWATSPAQRCQARFQRATLAFRRYEPGSFDQLHAVLREAEALELTRLAMECRVLLTCNAMRERRYREGLMHGRACLDWIEAHGGLRWRGELHNYLTQVHGVIGSVSQALKHHAQAISIARELGIAHHVASVVDTLAHTLWTSGRSADAIKHCDEAVELIARHEVPPANTDAIWMRRGLVCIRLGRYDEATAAFQHAQGMLDSSSPGLAAGCTGHLAACFAELGQWARVQALLGAHHPGCQTSQPTLSALRAAAGLRQAMGLPATSELHDLRKQLPEEAIAERGSCLLQLAPELAPEQALQELDALRAELGPLGFDGHVVTAHIRSAQIAVNVDPALAREHALQALELAKTRDVVCAYRGELWLHCARALQAAGDTARAAEVLAEGEAWVQSTAAHHVPPEFRDGFLHRNPVNAELLARAARLRSPQPITPA